MSYTFATCQIAELARDAEEQSHNFYQYLTYTTDNGMIKAFFGMLAEQEADHKAAFAKLADKYRQKGDLYEYSIDLYAVLKRDIDKMKELNFSLHSAPKLSSVQGAVDAAIMIERNAVEAYTEMQKALTDEFRSILDSIIKAEKNHLQLVQDFQKTLRETNLI